MASVHFPEFRRFEQSRIEANDSLMALLIAARLGRHALSLNAGSPHTLPSIFPGVAEVGRLNRTVSDASAMIDVAEVHMTYMAIPYVLAVHSTLLVAALRMLRRDGRFPGTRDPSWIDLSKLHETFQIQASASLPITWLKLFHFARELRNRIIHHGALEGGLKQKWLHLPTSAKAEWQRVATRSPALSGPNQVLQVDTNELRAVLAITKHLSDAVNVGLQSALSRQFWIQTVVDDAAANSPDVLHSNKRSRKLAGYARTLYGPLHLTPAEFSAAGF